MVLVSALRANHKDMVKPAAITAQAIEFFPIFKTCELAFLFLTIILSLSMV